MIRSFFAIALLCVAGSLWASPPTNFRQAKILAKTQVYHDQAQGGFGDLYCGCSWTWVGESGGRMDLASCGYVPRARPERAARLEWEHVVPASWFGQQRLCWQNGGRDNCQATDPVFSAMEADLHNLYPAVGEVNGDRSNYALFVLPATTPATYGQCQTKVDFKQRVTDPRPAVRGMVARIHFYMADRYGLRLSAQQQRVLMAWDRHYPPTEWERERDRRIARIMGVSNPFVSGARQWTERGVVGQGVVQQTPATAPAPAPQPSIPGVADQLPAVLGNRNSGIYHVRGVCPGYEKISERNRVAFASEQQAIAAGFRKAGNCQN